MGAAGAAVENSMAGDVAAGGGRVGRNAFAEEGFSKAKEISTERLIKVFMHERGESRAAASAVIHEIKAGCGMSPDDNLMLDRKGVLWTPTGVRVGPAGEQ